jgi:hypothetical protein
MWSSHPSVTTISSSVQPSVDADRLLHSCYQLVSDDRRSRKRSSDNLGTLVLGNHGKRRNGGQQPSHLKQDVVFKPDIVIGFNRTLSISPMVSYPCLPFNLLRCKQIATVSRNFIGIQAAKGASIWSIKSSRRMNDSEG